MADTVHIPRIDYDGFGHPPGPGWSPVEDTQGNRLKPLIRCLCGVWSGIGLHHVHADGRVTQSFYHAHSSTGLPHSSPDGCGWHVFLILDNYDQGDFPPEP